MAPHRPGSTSITQRNAVVVIAAILVGAALYWLRGLLTPLALAVFLLVMIDGLARLVSNRLPGCPRWAAMPAAIGIVLLAFGASVFIVADNAASFAGQLTTYVPRLNAMIADVARLFGAQALTITELWARVDAQAIIAVGVGHIQSFGGDALLVLIYLGFLLASRRGWEHKVESLFAHDGDREEAEDVFTRLRVGVEKYLWVQTVTGLMIAIASWIVMAALGLNNALFWAFFIFLTGYIPVIGPALGTILPAVFALVQFQTYWPAIIIFGAGQAVNFLVGNLIYPRMQGQSLNLDPVVVLVSLAFWSAMWGLAGAFLSTPLTVMTMVLLAQFDGTRWIAVLISQNGKPLGEERVRQKRAAALPAPVTEL